MDIFRALLLLLLLLLQVVCTFQTNLSAAGELNALRVVVDDDEKRHVVSFFFFFSFFFWWGVFLNSQSGRWQRSSLERGGRRCRHHRLYSQ